MFDVIIIGGGLSGLINAILLSTAGVKTLLVERKQYPFHRVCGEYISNEVIPFLKSIDCFPEEYAPSRITKFKLTSVKGNVLEMPLDLGGFGISRYELDFFLSKKAIESGAEILERETVEEVSYLEDIDEFITKTKNSGSYKSKVVIGSFGKRSNIDSKLARPFFKKRSPYIGVKYHIKTDFDRDTIALHNFNGGYCGISMIEDEKFNLCYLGSRKQLKHYRSIPEMEKSVLHENPFLKDIFNNSEFLFDKPVVINEFSFEKKEPVYKHILMSGDAAGLITPLCGNGMALAIHSAKICSDLVIKYFEQIDFTRKDLEGSYTREWNKLFSFRLWSGRQIQKLFGAVNSSNLAVMIGKKTRPIAGYLMSKTHGQPF